MDSVLLYHISDPSAPCCSGIYLLVARERALCTMRCCICLLNMESYNRSFSRSNAYAASATPYTYDS